MGDLLELICTKCHRRASRLQRKKWCSSCYNKGLRNGTIRRLKKRAATYKAVDWAQDFIILYDHRVGLTTRASFAKAMNMKLATFDQKLNRARKAGLISKRYTLPREETL